MESTYQNPEHPASFGGVNALHRVLGGKRKDIKNWLAKKDSYTLHKPLRRRFPRNRVIVAGINDQFQADLVDMQSLAKWNKGYKYILTCIDIFSKYAWAVPLKDKSGSSVKSVFEKIFRDRKPESLQTDKGTEFKNKTVQNLFKKWKVHFFTTQNETKASVVERFNRTLKTKMWKYFTEFNTRNYVDVLDKLIRSYNHTYHRSIKMEPVSVDVDNQALVERNLYGDSPEESQPGKLKVGDTVRISKVKRKFEKGYESNWTREIFTIHQIIPRIPVVYKLKDLGNEVIDGTFYEYELQKVTDSGYYPVEKVLKKRKLNGRTQYFVKFVGYPEKFNDWVWDVKRL